MSQDKISKMVQKDISRCEEAQRSKNGSESLYRELIAKYNTFIPDFAEQIPFSGKVTAPGNEFDYRTELNCIKAKLSVLLDIGFEFRVPEYSSGSKQMVNIQLDNRNELTVSINLTFEEAKKQVEKISSGSELDEIIGKIDSLERIVTSDITRDEKWNQSRKIIKWVADKSVDVLIVILPLILKATQ